MCLSFCLLLSLYVSVFSVFVRPVCLITCVYVYLPRCLLACLIVGLSIFHCKPDLSACMSDCIRLSVRLSVWLAACLWETTMGGVRVGGDQ